MIIGLGIGLQFSRQVSSSEGQTFIALATDAGYTGGSAACADQTFDALLAIPALGYDEAVAYFDLADAASYTGGSLFCSELTFQSLIDIT